jgi:hypothetical protein
MVVGMRNLLGFLAALCLLPASLRAQAAPAPSDGGAQPQPASTPAELPPDKAPRRLLFVMESGLESGYSADQMIILKRSFLTALSDRDDAPTPIDFGSKQFPSGSGDRNKVARDAGADCWLLVRVSGLGGSPAVSALSYDLLYNLKTLDFTAHRSQGFSMVDIFRERWDDVITPILKKYPPLIAHAYSRGPPAPVTLTIRGVPGTVITGLSPKPISVGAGGTVAIDLPSPSAYSLRAAARGYVPTRTSLYLDGETELPLTQERSPWLKLDVAFLDGFFPGLSATFAWPALPFFARAGFTTFRAGIAVNVGDSIGISVPLSQLTLLLGIYLSPEDNPIRWYVGAGPLLRVSLPTGGSFTIDQLVPFGVQAVGGLELPLVGKLKTFIEYTPGWYYTPQPDLFLLSFGSNGGSTFPYLNLPPTGAVDLFELRLGLRYAL